MPTVAAPASHGDVDVRLVVDEVGAGRLRARATSTRRFEFDEVSEPATSTTSASRAIARTACWRFEVA